MSVCVCAKRLGPLRYEWNPIQKTEWQAVKSNLFQMSLCHILSAYVRHDTGGSSW